MLRLGGGDLNAVVGLLGFVLGICIGIVFLRRGFDLKRSYPARTLEGTTLPAVMTGLLLLVLLQVFLCLHLWKLQSVQVQRLKPEQLRQRQVH